jgi:hypothetical protein
MIRTFQIESPATQAIALETPSSLIVFPPVILPPRLAEALRFTKTAAIRPCCTAIVSSAGIQEAGVMLSA